ncbi:glycerol-3-phosphate acyltransferase [Chloroflexota bacterium]
MLILRDLGILLAAYILGSIPFGLMIVRWRTGKDLRSVESGRTGGTNAMRAAGFPIGLLTVLLDGLKGAGAVWMASAMGANAWITMLAPIAAVIGHNYSIFLIERREGRIHLGGGAGGATVVGGAFGLWPPSLLIIFTLGFLVWFGIGYASMATMSVAFFAIIVFLVRAMMGLSPWAYVLYGVLAEILLVWALRPNIKRLREGTERLHGWRAKRKQADGPKDAIKNG